MSKGLLIVVSGFTGSGKGTVLQKLTEMAPEKYTRCITMTTRAMRPGEQDGIDYIFCPLLHHSQLTSSFPINFKYTNATTNRQRNSTFATAAPCPK